jgi:hypothetical protein
MPVAVGFTPPDIFLIHASGEVTYPEIQRSIDRILAHPELADRRKLLVDGHAVTGAPSSSELRAIVRDMKPLFDHDVSTMAVVTDKEFVYGVARMFAVFAEAFGLHVRAFRTMEEAERWLVAESGEM